jgi:hypothetical protein
VTTGFLLRGRHVDDADNSRPLDVDERQRAIETAIGAADDHQLSSIRHGDRNREALRGKLVVPIEHKPRKERAGTVRADTRVAQPDVARQSLARPRLIDPSSDDPGPVQIAQMHTIAVGTPITGRHRVTGGGHPPPVPTERGVRISRTNALRKLVHSTASACSSEPISRFRWSRPSSTARSGGGSRVPRCRCCRPGSSRSTRATEAAEAAMERQAEADRYATERRKSRARSADCRPDRPSKSGEPAADQSD